MLESKFTPRRLCLLAIAALLFSSHAALAQFTQQGSKLVGSGGVSNAHQGGAVSLSSDGNTLITGGIVENGNEGAAWVFTRSGTTWHQLDNKLVGSGAIGSAQQGQSVALSGDGNTALVGGWWDNFFVGAAWVFVRSGNTWSQQGAKLVANDAVDVPSQGISVALSEDGNTAIVGGYSDDNSLDPGNAVYKGAAWIYTRSGTTWTQQAKLVANDGSGGSRLGAAVSLSADGNTALVGGYLDNNQQGAAWVFTRSGATWTQQGNKLVGTGGNFSNQGVSVALSADGTTAAVGGNVDSTLGVLTGAVWVFTRSGNTWTQQGDKLIGTGAVLDSEQGSSVALSADGNTLLSGGIVDNSQIGAAWVFTRSGGVWSQFNSKLVGNDVENLPQQGFGVALSGNGRTAVVGGPKDHNSIGATWVYAQPVLPATVTLVSSDSTSVFGQSVTFTATVTAGATGGVAFKRNSTILGTVSLSSGYFVAWASNGQDGSLFGIYGQRYNAAGAKAGSELHISTTTTGNQTMPQVAGLKAGGIVAVWQSDGQDGSSSGIYAQNFNATGGKVGAEFRVNTTTALAQTLPAIAPLTGGGFLIAWTSNGQDTSGLGVYAQRYDAAANKVGTEFLVNTTTLGAQSAPTIAALTSGGFTIFWQGPDAAGLGIYGQRYTAAGIKSGAEFRVNATTANDQSLPSATALSDGGSIVAWHSALQDSSGLGVYAQRYKATGARNGGEFRVNTTMANDQWQPQVSGFSNGGFATLWSSRNQDGSGQGVYAQAYKATGAKANVEFRVNTTTSMDQWQPGVAAAATGEFMAVWTSFGQDGSIEGVFTQRLLVPVSP